VAINTILCKLVRHYPSRSIADQDIDSVCLWSDLLRCLRHSFPIAHVAFQPGYFSGGFGAHFLWEGEDEEFVNIVGKKGVDAAVANTFWPTRGDSYFSFEAWDFVEGE